jgi:hypothetical protein
MSIKATSELVCHNQKAVTYVNIVALYLPILYSHNYTYIHTHITTHH